MFQHIIYHISFLIYDFYRNYGFERWQRREKGVTGRENERRKERGKRRELIIATFGAKLRSWFSLFLSLRDLSFSLRLYQTIAPYLLISFPKSWEKVVANCLIIHLCLSSRKLIFLSSRLIINTIPIKTELPAIHNYAISSWYKEE